MSARGTVVRGGASQRAQEPAQTLATEGSTADTSEASNARQRGAGGRRMALVVLIASLACSKPDPCARDRELYDAERSRAASSSWVLLARDNLLRCVCPAAHSHASAFPSRASAEALELCAEQRGVQ